MGAPPSEGDLSRAPRGFTTPCWILTGDKGGGELEFIDMGTEVERSGDLVEPTLPVGIRGGTEMETSGLLQ